MKIVKLKEEQYNLFKGMDPFSMIPRTKLGNGFVLGAFEQDADGYDIPAGVVVCIQTEDAVIVSWLWIEAEYQEQGLGTLLVDRIVELSAKQKISRVMAYFTDSYLQRSLCPGSVRFFQEYGLNQETELSGEWLTDVRSALKKYNDLSKADLEGVVLLGGCKEAILNEYVGTALKQQEAEFYFALDKDEIRFEPKISFVIADKSGIRGAILNTVLGGVIYPICFWAESETEEQKLVYASLLAAKALYGEASRICVIKSNDHYLDIVKKTMGEDYSRNFLIGDTVENLLVKKERKQPLVVLELGDTDSSRQSENDIAQFLKPGEEKQSSFGILAKKADIKGDEDFGMIGVIGSLSVAEFQEFLLECRYHNNTGAFERLLLNPDLRWFDPDLSCFYKADGKIKSILLVNKRDDGSISPMILYVDAANNTAFLFQLLKYMCVKGIEKYGEDSPITICCYNEKMTALYEKLFME